MAASANGSTRRYVRSGTSLATTTFFAIVGTILNGAGMTREAIIISAVLLAVAAVANWLVIPRFVPGRDLLTACSAATGGAMAVGALAGGLILRSRLGAFLPLLSALRVAAAAAAAVAVGRVLPFATPIGTLIEAAAVGMTFLVSLIVLRELGRDDLAAFGRVAGRKKG